MPLTTLGSTTDAYLDLIDELPLRRIRTASVHAKAKRIILRLAAKPAGRGAADYIDVLIDLVADYEARSGPTHSTRRGYRRRRSFATGWRNAACPSALLHGRSKCLNRIYLNVERSARLEQSRDSRIGRVLRHSRGAISGLRRSSESSWSSPRPETSSHTGSMRERALTSQVPNRNKTCGPHRANVPSAVCRQLQQPQRRRDARSRIVVGSGSPLGMNLSAPSSCRSVCRRGRRGRR